MPGADDQNQPGADDKEKPKPKPEDEKAQGGEGEPGEEGDGESEADGLDLSDPEKAKALVQKLRKENAKYRVKNKETSQRLSSLEQKLGGLKKALGVEGEEISPEEKAAQLASKNEALEVELTISRLSREYDIPKEHDKYFRFLLAQKFEGLGEGEELSDEDLGEIVKEVKVVSGKKAGSATGVNAGKKPPADNGDGLTVEEFSKMNVGQKSALYVKNPAEYNRLFSGAKEKGLL